MTELLWALLIILICVLFTWLGVGALCSLGLVEQCQLLVTPYLI